MTTEELESFHQDRLPGIDADARHGYNRTTSVAVAH